MKKNRTRKITKYSVATCSAELKNIRKHYKEIKSGYRHEVRMTLQSTQIILGRLCRSQTLRNAYRSSVLKTRKNQRGFARGEFDLSLEVVCAATGAVSREARQLASKRARVLDYLRGSDVPDNETAQFIKKNGGVEKLYNASIRAKSAQAGQSDPKIRTDGKKNPKVEPDSPTLNNDQIVEVKVMMPLSDRDKIAENKIGTEITLSGKIASKGKVQILSVTLVTEEEDWD